MPFELYLVTFNCARNLVNPETLAPPLFEALPEDIPIPDVLALSLQEIAPIAYSFLGGSYLTPYFDRIATTVHLAANLRSHGRETLVPVATRSLGMTGLMVFAKQQFAERIHWVQSAGAGVGVWNMGNKGAVAMRLGVAVPDSNDTLQLTLAAAHLAPMECKVEARNKDWETVVRNLVFLNNDQYGFSTSEEQPLLSSRSSTPPPPPDGKGLFTSSSHLFFAGDLNYRTHDKPPGPEAYRTYPQPAHPESSPSHWSQWLKTDQLLREKDANRTLHGLNEMPILFPPTYKYSMKQRKQSAAHKRSDADPEESWVWAKHRYPSWCDRVLFLDAPSLASKFNMHEYTALPVQPTSDHRPVALSLSVEDKAIKISGGSDIRFSPPFPLNPDWQRRRDVARQYEVIVGVLSYLALTKKGNAIIVTFASIAFVSLWVGGWLHTR